MVGDDQRNDKRTRCANSLESSTNTLLPTFEKVACASATQYESGGRLYFGGIVLTVYRQAEALIDIRPTQEDDEMEAYLGGGYVSESGGE